MYKNFGSNCQHVKKAAFTLAEVLITLAIIGVVAAITIPTLISNYNERIKVVKLKKVYSALNNVYAYVISEYGDINYWMSDCENTDLECKANSIGKKFAQYMHVDKYCGYEKSNYICWKNNAWFIDNSGGHGGHPCGNKPATFISNGLTYAVCIAPEYPFTVTKNTTTYWGSIYVDLSGQTEENYLGKNVFIFFITDKGIIPSGAGNYSDFNSNTPYPFDIYCRNENTLKRGLGCTAWVLKYENLDYLNLNCKNLSWNGKTKCD